LNIRVKNNISNIEWFIDHYSYSYRSFYHFFNESENAYSTTFSGRIYHSELGYLDIKSTVQFERNGSSKHLEGREMILLGANSTRIVITAIDYDNYRIGIDTDNNGIPESTESKLWENSTSDDELSIKTFLSPYYY